MDNCDTGLLVTHRGYCSWP